MSGRKEVLVVGFGAVGVLYSFIIKRSGKANVTCVARSNFETTKVHGVRIRSRKYGDIQGWRPDRLFRTVADAADRPYEYVLVTTKALPAVVSTASLLEPLFSQEQGPAHPLPSFVVLQNGLSVERDLFEAIKRLNTGEPNIISAALWVGTNLLEGNVVDHSHPERLSIGMYRENYLSDVINTPKEAAVLQGFAQLLEAGGSPVRVVDEMQKIKFKKNFWNAAFATCSTLARYPLPAFVLDPTVEATVIPQIRAMMLEVLAIGRAMGFGEDALPSSVVDTAIEGTTRIHKAPDSIHRPSMLLDVESGRPMEVEAILGELIGKARELHVDAPRLELVHSLLCVIQNQLVKRK